MTGKSGRKVGGEGGISIRPMTIDDVPMVQSIGRTTWSDVASRDIGRPVEYPLRPAGLIKAYMGEGPGGCLIASVDGVPVGDAYCHVWGSVGWIGPIEVLPEWQDEGIGHVLMASCESYLASKGCRVNGVETMSDQVRNLHFYRSHGYRDGGTTVFAEKKLRPAAYFVGGIKELDAANLHEESDGIRRISSLIFPGMDCTPEFHMFLRDKVGRGYVCKHGDTVKGAVLMIDSPMEGLKLTSLRLLVTDPTIPDREQVLSSLMAVSEQAAIGLGMERIFTSCSVTEQISRVLVEREYKIAGSNVRLVKGDDYVEAGGASLIAWAG